MADLDLARVKRNVGKMVSMGAPETDIDAYIAEEGTTVDAVRAFRPASGTPVAATPPVASPGPGGGYGDQDVNGRAGSTLLGALDGASFGFADEIGAGINAGIDAGLGAITGREGKSYDEWLSKMRGLQTNAQEQHPYAHFTGQVAGALAQPVGKARSVAEAALQGAVQGGAYGFGSSDGTIKDRIENAGYGLIGGAALGGTVHGAANALGTSAVRALIPGADDLAAEARVLYDKADAARVSIKAPSFQRAIDNMKFAAGRINRDLRPKTAGVVDDVQALSGRDISLGEMDELRQTINKSLVHAEPQDELMLGRMKTILDGFADNASASDVTGDVAGLQYLKDARPIWARKSKAELIDGMVERAKDASSGYETGLKAQFRSLLGKPDRLKGFTDEEVAAMRAVVRGGPGEQTLRFVSKLDPTKPLGAAISTLTGVGVSAPFGAASAATGMASRMGADAITRGNVRALDEMVRTGGKTATQLALEAAQGRGDQRTVDLIQNYLDRSARARAPAALGGAMATTNLGR